MNYKNYVVFIIILNSSIWSVSASTNGNIVFGPVTYERTTGSPNIFIDNFSVPYLEGNFTLYLENGKDSKNKISSATIILNGETIVRQNEFNQTVDYINKSIKLKPYNNIQVQINSNPTGFITLYILSEYSAPVVEINFPINSAYHPVKVPLDGTPVKLKTAVMGTIRGTVVNTTLKVNNEDFNIPVINGSFYWNVTLTEGANQISIFAVDSLGNTGNASIVAYVENTNAELKIPVPLPSQFENDKLGVGLNYTAYLYETQGFNAALTYLAKDPNNIIENGAIRVRISIIEDNITYVDMLKSLGLNVLYIINTTDIGGDISVYSLLPISKIREVEDLQFVKIVYVSSKPALQSITEGDAIIGSDKIRNLGFSGLNPDGSPVKIAVIDDPGSQHEAKVMDVIRSIAPGARIISYSGDWIEGIRNARDNVDIISVSMVAFDLDLDGTDGISKEIKITRINDTLYINAAGNSANLHYKGMYQDNNQNGWHEFAQYSKGYDETLDAEWSFFLDSTVTAYLHLDQADFDKLDIKVGINNTGLLPIISTSEAVQSKGVKRITLSTGNFSDIRFFVANSSKYNSSDVIGTPFHIFVYPEPKELPLTNIKVDWQHQWVDNPVQEYSIPAPATSKYSFTVGATYSDLVESYANEVAFLAAVYGITTGDVPPALAVILSSIAASYTFPQDGLAYFSSQGPVYDAAGNAIIKPDVVAPTFVSTDHGIFGGTSASAPHVAGAAALLLSANPNLTANQIQQILEESAVDLGDTGKDNKYGAGRIDVYEAVKRVTPDLQSSNIQFIPDTATKGQNITIRTDISNIGRWDAGSTEVQMLKDGVIINTSIIPALKSGDMITVETTWVPENMGSYNISVTVDPRNKVREFNESNNYVNKTVSIVPLPDFMMSSITLSTDRPAAYVPFSAYASLYNNGTDTGTLYFVYVTAELDGHQASAWVPVFSGGRTDLIVNLVYYSGTYTFTLAADPLDYIREINETNNIARKTFTIFPYLTISNMEERSTSLNISYKEFRGSQKN